MAKSVKKDKNCKNVKTTDCKETEKNCDKKSEKCDK